MAWDPDTSYGGDYAFLDHVETLTFEARDVAGASKASVLGIAAKRVTTVKGKRLDISTTQQAFGNALQVTSTDVVWRLWDSTMGGNVPAAADTVTDSNGDVYSILDVVKQRPGPTWVCRTIKEPT